MGTNYNIGEYPMSVYLNPKTVIKGIIMNKLSQITQIFWDNIISLDIPFESDVAERSISMLFSIISIIGSLTVHLDKVAYSLY